MMSSTPVLQEIVEKVPSTQQNVTAPAEEKPDLDLLHSKIKEFVGRMLRLEGPKVGVQYKIEVTGKLSDGGLFWACPVSSGFIQEKLEPLSNLLKSAIQADPVNSSTIVKYNELICVQSLANNLWMRGLLVEENDDSLSVRLVDVGRIEIHKKNKLYKVPPLLASIPYMSFCCTLFEDSFEITRDDKWRFSDLVKKKILNFSCKKIIKNNAGKLVLLFGMMETIIDKPIININEEMKRCLRKKNGDIHTKSYNVKKSNEPCKKVDENISHNAKKSNEPCKKVVENISHNAKKSNKLCEKVVENGELEFGKKLETLLTIAGPIFGAKYKIEVTSPLNVDGTFWACPITSGFIRDKLEPMSDLLKEAIQSDSGLKHVNFDQLICVQSKENRLLSRGIVMKETGQGTVKLQLIDIGRTEDHSKDKLSKVPESLASIPYMAFHCALFEEKVKLSYEERWRFADLCRRKIVEFTCEKSVERDQKKLLIGKIETITGKNGGGRVNVSEAVKHAKMVNND